MQDEYSATPISDEALRKIGYTGFTVEALYSDFMRETPKIGFWLDTSEQSPAQTVEAILLHFEE